MKYKASQLAFMPKLLKLYLLTRKQPDLFKNREYSLQPMDQIQPAACFINKVFGTQPHIVYGYVPIKTVELSSCNRDHKSKIFIIWSLIEKVS